MCVDLKFLVLRRTDFFSSRGDCVGKMSNCFVSFGECGIIRQQTDVSFVGYAVFGVIPVCISVNVLRFGSLDRAGL